MPLKYSRVTKLASGKHKLKETWNVFWGRFPQLIYKLTQGQSWYDKMINLVHSKMQHHGNAVQTLCNFKVPNGLQNLSNHFNTNLFTLIQVVHFLAVHNSSDLHKKKHNWRLYWMKVQCATLKWSKQKWTKLKLHEQFQSEKGMMKRLSEPS